MEISRLSQFLQAVKRFRGNTDDEVWFRGHSDGNYKLTPGLYRRADKTEYSFVSSFLSMAPAYLDENQLPGNSRPLGELWEWYFLMQHYGMPTRLLDWTENPLVGLYFAVCEAVQDRRPSSNPCVWMLKPGLLNHWSCDDEGIIVPGGLFSQHWLFAQHGEEEHRCHVDKKHYFRFGNPSQDYCNDTPIAIYPVRSNPRIIAQQGIFTVHGTSPDPLEDLFGEGPHGPKRRRGLYKIEIDRDSAYSLLAELQSLTVRNHVLFPELQNVAGYIVELHEGPDGEDGGEKSGSSSTSKKVAKRKRKKKVAKRKVKKKVAKRKVKKKKAKRKVARRR